MDHSQHRRITDKLLSYWNTMKGNRHYPEESDINPDDLGEVWDHCFVVQVEQNPEGEHSFSFSHLGPAIRKAYETELNEDFTLIIASPYAERLRHKYEEVIRTLSPVLDEGRCMTRSDLTLEYRLVKYRQCLLPLGSTDGTVDAILGGMRCKVSFEEDEE